MGMQELKRKYGLNANVKSHVAINEIIRQTRTEGEDLLMALAMTRRIARQLRERGFTGWKYASDAHSALEKIHSTWAEEIFEEGKALEEI